MTLSAVVETVSSRSSVRQASVILADTSASTTSETLIASTLLGQWLKQRPALVSLTKMLERRKSVNWADTRIRAQEGRLNSSIKKAVAISPALDKREVIKAGDTVTVLSERTTVKTLSEVMVTVVEDRTMITAEAT